MVETAKSVHSMEELRRYVADTLSSIENLRADQFQLSQRVLHRGGRFCGIHFCLQGPRDLRLSAIWETDQNSILFYDSCGRRMQRTKLAHSPSTPK